MDIADVDLNLLVVFDALLRNRSVSGAARALKMSQPATSFALNRLRKMFGEPLFVPDAGKSGHQAGSFEPERNATDPTLTADVL